MANYINIISIGLILSIFVLIILQKKEYFDENLPKLSFCNYSLAQKILNKPSRDEVDFAILRILNGMNCIDEVQLGKAFTVDQQEKLNHEGVFVGVPTTNFLRDQIKPAMERYPEFSNYIKFIGGFIST